MLLRHCLASWAVGVFFSAAALAGTYLDQAKQQFQGSDFGSTIATVDRALNSRDAAILDKDRYELLMLKAESLVQLKRDAFAAKVFRNAMTAAPDLPRAAVAQANALVIEASTAQGYKPSGQLPGGKEVIDIYSRETRKDAMRALLRDLRPKVQKQYDSALSATTLPALERAMEVVFEWYCLEYTTEGDPDAALNSLTKLGEHAQQLIEHEVARLRLEVSMIERSADTYDGFTNSRRGLSSPERKALMGMNDYLQQVYNRIVDYRRISLRLEGKGDRWDALLADTADLMTRSSAVLRLDSVN
jgi:hypothetical protein